jgi:aminobenzoyl-glutamate utilization protein B
MADLDRIWERILKCAQAAALATETRLETEIVNSVWDVLPNPPLSKLLDRNLNFVGGVRYTPAEHSFAEAVRKTFDAGATLLGSQEAVVPQSDPRGLGGSTDVGDVSWLLPTAQFTAAAWAPGTPAHSWQSTAFSGMSIGEKGMLVAAKTLALTALDIVHDPAQAGLARAAFEKLRQGRVYQSRIPENQRPPLNYRAPSSR